MTDAPATWRAALPDVVADVAARLSLTLGEPYRHDGLAWVAPARDAAGRDLALKIGFPHDEALHEAEGLRVLDGGATVRLVRTLAHDDAAVLLLERCDPGTPLSAVLPGPEQDVVVAGLLGRLRVAPPPGHPFRPLAAMCAWWADSFERRFAAADPGRRPDAGLVREGLRLFRELPAAPGPAVLLCTDLHAGNVLAARREPWLVIDPKPYVGDPAYDVLQHLLNCPDRLTADPVGLARRMADLAGLDPDHVRRWLFARCVLASLDLPHAGAALARLAG